MSLIFISLLSILVVGFLTSMRSEVAMAESHARSDKARNFTQAGTDMAIARLRYATSTATPGRCIWASQPGQIVMATRATSLGSFGSFQSIPLHSGAGTRGESDSISADLNGGTQYFLTRQTDQMRVKWIYMLKNGDLSTAVPAYSASDSNPAVGRFAFWVDDESARINLNTAYTRNTDDLWSSPSQVNLRAFSTLNDTILSQLKTFRAGRPFLYTLQELRSAGISQLTSLLDSDKFSLTVNSQAPEINMFGEPRIVLTTQKKLAGNAPFLDILNSDNKDPGRAANLNGVKVGALVKTLSAILNRSDWPIASGQSFGGKFSPVKSQQIALNIIDYVRSKESTEPLIEPTRGLASGVDGFTLDTFSGKMMGNARTFKFTEMAYFIKDTSTATKTQYALKIRAEIHLPSNSGAPTIDLNTYTFTHYIGGNPSIYYQGVANGLWGRYLLTGTPSAAMVVGGDYKMKAGEYRVIEVITGNFTIASPIANGPPGKPSDVNRIWPGLSITGNDPNSRYAYSTLDQSVSYTYSAAIVTENGNWPTLAVDDPALSVGNGNWKAQTASEQTMTPSGGPPSALTINTLNTIKVVAGTAPQDMAGGLLTNVGIQLPNPAGTGNNSKGVVESVAELGYIHTGIASEDKVVGVPWRTLRLQPKSDDTLPDWLLLDMFTAPKLRWLTVDRSSVIPTSLSYAQQPYAASSGTAVDGRMGGAVNVNATIVPTFALSSGTAPLTRTASLQAAFFEAYTDAASSGRIALATSTVIADSIASRTLSTTAGGKLYGLTSSMPLVSRGQIAEMTGVTDSGEESENKLRGVIDLLTTRGSVFRIYSVGQAVRPAAANSFTVLGEQRMETVVERVSSADGTQVKLNVISNQMTKP